MKGPRTRSRSGADGGIAVRRPSRQYQALGGSPGEKRAAARARRIHPRDLAQWVARGVTVPFRRHACPPGRQGRRASDQGRRLGRTGLVGRDPARLLAAHRMARRSRGADRLLAVQPARRPPIAGLVRLAKVRWRIEHDYRELKHGVGLDHFEGRSWPGWHHHVTLVTAAHAFLTEQHLAPQVPGPASRSTKSSIPSRTP
ncbi:transposase [Streptomyces sp. NPDC013978]|uniref:transposase n=1 Tax=Streptomyces sp. NPDC013978 TaxID=3364869 RepID=UPI0036FA061F